MSDGRIRRHGEENIFKNEFLQKCRKRKNKLQIQIADSKTLCASCTKNCPCKFIFGISTKLSALSALSLNFIYLYTNHAHIEFPSNPPLTLFYSSTLHSRAMCPVQIKGGKNDMRNILIYELTNYQEKKTVLLFYSIFL